jgi:serine/threonine protein kinase
MSGEAFDRWPHLDELFEQVAALAPAERSGFLDGQCAGEPELRRELEGLLAAHDAHDDFLENAPPWIGPPPTGDFPPTGEADSWIGRTIDHYEVLETLGSGGMGVVYKARDTRLDRIVTLKFLQPHLVAQQDAKARFIHEAKAASALDHSNICTVYDIDETPDGQLFIAMAYYAGETLADRIARGPLPIGDSLDIAVEIAEALGRAHQAGIVHRDLKPANVMLTERAEVKLLDFGIAKLEGTAGLTKTGVLMGTVAYMSPEQAGGDNVDHRADIWSLGVVLYELLTGVRPFRGDNAQAVLYSILHEEPKPITSVRAHVNDGAPPGRSLYRPQCAAE